MPSSVNDALLTSEERPMVVRVVLGLVQNLTLVQRHPSVGLARSPTSTAAAMAPAEIPQRSVRVEIPFDATTVR